MEDICQNLWFEFWIVDPMPLFLIIIKRQDQLCVEVISSTWQSSYFINVENNTSLPPLILNIRVICRYLNQKQIQVTELQRKESKSCCFYFIWNLFSSFSRDHAYRNCHLRDIKMENLYEQKQQNKTVSIPRASVALLVH